MKKIIFGILFFVILLTLFLSISLYTNKYNVDLRESIKLQFKIDMVKPKNNIYKDSLAY